MDDINDFFDFSKNFVRKTVPRGCVSGTVATTAGTTEDSKQIMKREYLGNEYSVDVAEAERLKLEQVRLPSIYIVLFCIIINLIIFKSWI